MGIKLETGGWTVLSDPYRIKRFWAVDAVCGCGTKRIVRLNSDGSLRSSACVDCIRKHSKYGENVSRSRTYRCWQSIRDRCNNVKAKAYPQYGGRGIRVCKRWEEYTNFFEDMGEMPEKMSIGRIDNNGHYEPGNCRWETREEQNNNTRQNVFLTYKGETLTAAQWGKKFGVNRRTLLLRLRKGWTIEEIFETPFNDLAEIRRLRQGSETITYEGETLTLLQWERRTGIGRQTIKVRKRLGWSPEKIFTTPVKTPQRN